MRINTRILGGVAAVALLQLAGSNAFATLIGVTGPLPTGITRTSGYYTGNGGEFTIAGSGLDLSGYVSGSSGTRLAANSFQTFCIERDEYTFGNAGSYRINDQAIAGGVNTDSGDALSVGSAWLYSQFASKVWESGTPTFTYLSGSGREASAGLLQNAIWYLEGELGAYGGGNAFYDAAVAKFGASGAVAAAATAQYGVYVINTYNTPNYTGLAQDQLYYNPNGERVPDGGLCLTMLGMSLSGLALFRRRFQAA